jgi:hypothetical protein
VQTLRLLRVRSRKVTALRERRKTCGAVLPHTPPRSQPCSSRRRAPHTVVDSAVRWRMRRRAVCRCTGPAAMRCGKGRNPLLLAVGSEVPPPLPRQSDSTCGDGKWTRCRRQDWAEQGDTLGDRKLSSIGHAGARACSRHGSRKEGPGKRDIARKPHATHPQRAACPSGRSPQSDADRSRVGPSWPVLGLEAAALHVRRLRTGQMLPVPSYSRPLNGQGHRR